MESVTGYMAFRMYELRRLPRRDIMIYLTHEEKNLFQHKRERVNRNIILSRRWQRLSSEEKEVYNKLARNSSEMEKLWSLHFAQLDMESSYYYRARGRDKKKE